MIRTFIAIEMNENLQRHLTDVIGQVARLLPGVRWVDPAGIHLTLAFLGELDDERLAQAIEATESVARHVAPFGYRLSRLGIFGSPGQPRVIWMGIDEPSGVLLRVRRTLNWELQQRGFEIDRRPFSPHLTLARVKMMLVPEEQQHLQALLVGKQQDLVTSTVYAVNHLDVMKSELMRKGAQYTHLRSCVLGNR